MLLELRDVHVRYGTTHAVAGVDLEIGEAEAVCLLGPNGAGKTSVLHAISRLVPATGTIRFDGNDVRDWSPTRLAKAGLIHVPEGRHVFPTLSVHENLQMGDVPRAGRPARYRYDDVYDLLPALRRLRRRSGFALSGGEQQMVALGRALIAAPKLLLLDEPSLGLAPVVTTAVYEALRVVADDTPILLVEQKTSDALELANRGIVLVAGRAVMRGNAQELADRQSMVASYLGQRDAQPDEPHTLQGSG